MHAIRLLRSTFIFAGKITGKTSLIEAGLKAGENTKETTAAPRIDSGATVYGRRVASRHRSAVHRPNLRVVRSPGDSPGGQGQASDDARAEADALDCQGRAEISAALGRAVVALAEDDIDSLEFELAAACSGFDHVSHARELRAEIG